MSDDFVDWALAPERTLEERCSLEKAVEWGVMMDRGHRQLPHNINWEKQHEMRNARRLNPAYEPRLDPDTLRSGAAGLRRRTDYSGLGYQDRPTRDLSWLRFFPQFEQLHLNELEVADYSPLAALPRLRKLSIMDYLTVDLRPLGQCAALEELTVYLQQPWVKVEGLERLERLHTVHWNGSPHSLQSLPRWPAVRHAKLRGGSGEFPLRDALHFPDMPRLEALELENIFSLEGLERYPRLVNLTIAGPYRDLRPLTACRAITHLTLELSVHLNLDLLKDISPLKDLPELRFLHVRSQRPRDYSVLVEAPRLHEVSLTTPMLEPLQACAMELATLNATLEPWDGEFLLPAPRSLAPLTVSYIEPQRQEDIPQPPPVGDPPPWNDNPGFCQSEGRWLARRVSARLQKLLDNDPHWGEIGFSTHGFPSARALDVTLHSTDAAERLAEIIDAIRAELAWLKCAWSAGIQIHLEFPPVNDPKAMAEIERQSEWDDREDYERRRKEEAEFLERQHRLDLQKEAGAKIHPKDFAAPNVPAPAHPEEEDNSNDDNDDSGDIALKDPEEDAAQLLDPDRPHPLAGRYRLGGGFHEGGAWFYASQRQTAEYLLSGRPPP